MDTLLQDLKYSARLLIKTPSVTAIAILALALGIGVNTAIFSVVNTMILKPLPYENADRLMFLRESRTEIPRLSVAYPNYLDWRAESQSFEQMAIVRGQTYSLTGNRDPVRLMGAHVSSNMFSMLGAQPFAGRTFEPEDDHPGATPVAVLSYGLWQSRFGGDASILGQTLSLNGLTYTVIGMMPRDFKWFLHSQTPEIWTPIGLWAETDMLRERGNRSGMNVIARLNNDVTIEQAEADLALIAARLEEQYPETNTGSGISMTPLHERVVGDARTPLMILLGAVGLVMLIACANVANLLLARAAGRRKEIAVRVAMGAGRWRMVRQLLTESVVLALTGGIVGVFLATFTIDLLGALSPANMNMPRIDEVGIDVTVLGFTAILALATGVIFGLAPALTSSRPDLTNTLKESARGSTGGGGRVRGSLVVAEVALALVLLIGAGLLIKSFWRLTSASPGFNPDNVLTAQVVLTGSSYPDEDARRAFYHTLLERAQSLPGVRTAGIINPLPVSFTGWQAQFMIEGRPRPRSGEFPSTEWMQISPGYFQTMEIPLLRGRAFTEFDRHDTQKVVIIDEAFAGRHFPNEDPIGHQLAFGDPDNPMWREITGVVGHIKLKGVAEEAGIEMYMPYEQASYAPLTMILRTGGGDPQGVLANLRDEMQAIDPDLPLYNIRMMDELLENTVSVHRTATVLLTVFAVLALVLAAVGIYGVTSYTVSQRTHEIGIRIALGAQQTNVLGLVIRQGMTLVLAGLAIGVAASFGMTRLMGSLLFGVEPTDPVTFGIIPFILAMVALAASTIPARRASRLDPLTALRYE